MAAVDIIIGIVAILVVGWAGLLVIGWFSGDEGKALMLQRQAQQNPKEVKSDFDTLIEMLNSEDAKVRAPAVGAVGELAKEYPEDIESLIPRLINLLDDSSEEVQAGAARALAYVAETYPEDIKPATTKLVDLLYANDPETRISGLGAILSVIELSVSKEWEEEIESIATALIDSFSYISPEEYPLLLTALRDIADVYPQQVTPAEGELSNLLTHTDAEVRLDSCYIIKELVL